ncbi:Triplex capsid protein 1 [Cacatuid alphaherpesvirus 2]|uniref:Triplex capsid protein 1 n=1 Tax=Cacatuid alphaherpesvirus 2 TaxID=2604840 RepID=A0A5B9RBC8_9ALPH|nr:Triplex capsid protein 1 [Cacatuid alphaherpesvirus 2]QEG54065.1 Triplex capsid protein 1 [Cacatuid alphaherpesvirus 2]
MLGAGRTIEANNISSSVIRTMIAGNERLQTSITRRAEVLDGVLRTSYGEGTVGALDRRVRTQNVLTEPDIGGLRTNVINKISSASGTLKSRYVLATQVTVTDLCRPDVEGPGAVLFFFRGVKRLLYKLGAELPVRADLVNDLETSFMVLNRLCGIPVVGNNGINHFETTLISLNIIAAAGARHYRNNCEIENLRTFIIATHKDNNMAEKMRNLDTIMKVAVESKTFPHSLLIPAGAMTESVNSTNVACVKILFNGCLELMRATTKSCSSLRFPACLFLDLDDNGKCAPVPSHAAGGSLFFVYVLFLYSTEVGYPGYEVYIAKSILDEGPMRDMMNEVFERRRINNTIASATPSSISRDPPSLFSSCGLEEACKRACADVSRSAGKEKADADLKISFLGVPELWGSTYAAFCKIGFGFGEDSLCFTTVQRGGLSLKYIEIPKVFLEFSVWRVCS